MSILMKADRAGADKALPICEKSLLMRSDYKVEGQQLGPGQAKPGQALAHSGIGKQALVRPVRLVQANQLLNSRVACLGSCEAAVPKVFGDVDGCIQRCPIR